MCLVLRLVYTVITLVPPNMTFPGRVETYSARACSQYPCYSTRSCSSGKQSVNQSSPVSVFSLAKLWPNETCSHAKSANKRDTKNLYTLLRCPALFFCDCLKYTKALCFFLGSN